MRSAIFVAIDGVVAGVLGIGRQGATPVALPALREAGVRVVMLTGDNWTTARAVAKRLGIAMGTGTDVAIESAGATLLKGDLQGIVRGRRLSAATMRNIRENLFFAFIYSAAGVPVAAGFYPAFGLLLSPTIAAAAMALSSVSVIANSLRLRRSRALLEADAPLGRGIVWFELARIAFEPRRTRLRPSSHEQLNAIAEILVAHPHAMATIAAYGSARKSSKRRADALVEALTSLGVDASRLRSKALGSKPSLVTGSRNGSEPNGGLLLSVRSK